MPRPSSIWWNTGKDAYYAKINGKQVRLGVTKDEAQQAFDRLKLAVRAPELQDFNTCRSIFELYLDYIEQQHVESYRTAKKYLQSFLDFHKEIQVKDLRAVEVQRWINAHPTWVTAARTAPSAGCCRP
jgi:hypothetical protein